VGSRDELTPGDIVGAMTGEAGIAGDQVGKIDIRESHTTVEVATAVAGDVIQALNGRTLKGRALRVDYDRKTRAPRTPEGGRAPRSGGSGPRGGSKGPRTGGPRSGGSKGGPTRGGPRGGGSKGGSPRGGSGGSRPPRRG
jgi:ATP-dependent RNA helicase DeaD